MDFSDVKGREHVKRALEVALAGGHPILLYGPPGQGKTTLAHAARTIAPVRHAFGLNGPLTFIPSGTIGGAMDTAVLETWPCRCGGMALGTPVHPAFPIPACSCTPEQNQKHLSDLLPVFDAVDMVCEVPMMRTRDVQDMRKGEASEYIRLRVRQAREVQRMRYLAQNEPAFDPSAVYIAINLPVRFANASVRDEAHAEELGVAAAFAIGEGSQALLRTAVNRLGFPAELAWKVRRVARTLADLEVTSRRAPADPEPIGVGHISEAIQYLSHRDYAVAREGRRRSLSVVEALREGVDLAPIAET